MTRSLLLLSLAVSATCSPKPDPWPMPMPELDAGTLEDGGAMPVTMDCSQCRQWSGVEIMGPLPLELTELSGLAASAVMPGVFYGHNDSGDSARFFSFALNGQLLAELTLPGAGATDWEDMALGPCEPTPDGGTCLFLADIGDNLRQRPSYDVYRVREPDLTGVASGQVQPPIQQSLTFDRLSFIYPNSQRHNAETLLSHPLTGDLYILTKETSGTPGSVFKFPRPLTPNVMMTLIDLGPASVPQSTDSLVTGGDISPCGNSVLVRMYNRIVELRAGPDAGFESAFRAAPRETPMAIDEPQGEAIVWDPNGQGYFTASEFSGQSLHRVRCVRTP
jgi:hypothetical protein